MGPCHCLVKTVDFMGAEPNKASRILSLSLSIVNTVECDNFKSRKKKLSPPEARHSEQLYPSYSY